MDQTKVPVRDNVAEAESVAFEWVRYSVHHCVDWSWRNLLRDWDEAHAHPEYPGLFSRYHDLRKLDRSALYDVAYRAGRSAFWDVLEQYGYTHAVFGAEHQPIYLPPKSPEGKWFSLSRHAWKDMSARFRGMQNSVNHKRKSYLAVTPHVELKTESSVVVELSEGGRYTIRMDTVFADRVAATAGDMFEEAKRKGLLRGILHFGLLTKDLKSPPVPPPPPGKEAASAGAGKKTNTPPGNRAVAGARITLGDGTVCELSPGATMLIGDNVRVEALVASA